MKREKNPLKCTGCKEELPFGHTGLFCNFCTNQRRAHLATIAARAAVERIRKEKEAVKK